MPTDLTFFLNHLLYAKYYTELKDYAKLSFVQFMLCVNLSNFAILSSLTVFILSMAWSMHMSFPQLGKNKYIGIFTQITCAIYTDVPSVWPLFVDINLLLCFVISTWKYFTSCLQIRSLNLKWSGERGSQIKNSLHFLKGKGSE